MSDVERLDDEEFRFEWGGPDANHTSGEEVQKWILECVRSVRSQIKTGKKGYLWHSISSGDRVVRAEYWTAQGGDIEVSVLRPLTDYWLPITEGV